MDYQQMLPQQIVLASGNQKKLTELSGILNHFNVSLAAQSQWKVSEAIEDGKTFVENAIKKARNACEQTGLPAISDDSGIEVDFLNGAPGIFSARFAGENASDEDNLNHLLAALKDSKPAQRSARYQCVIVYMRHTDDPTPLICQANWQGNILSTPVGDRGFGYDPIFYCPIAKKTAAQMSPQEKAQVSHRGKALAQFQQAFQQMYAGK